MPGIELPCSDRNGGESTHALPRQLAMKWIGGGAENRRRNSAWKRSGRGVPVSTKPANFIQKAAPREGSASRTARRTNSATEIPNEFASAFATASTKRFVSTAGGVKDSAGASYRALVDPTNPFFSKGS